MSIKINVIDLFAGPGGLGEGFSAYTSGQDGEAAFKIRMSVEKEPNAHRTLTLRALYRAVQGNASIRHYHDYVSGRMCEPELKSMLRAEWAEATYETLNKPTELGKDNKTIHQRVRALKEAHANESWVVIGGPPCQAYSLAGRSRNRGIKDYRPENDHRHFLYQEYLRVLSIIQPDVFVMENVKGILTSKVGDVRIFPEIRSDLKNPTKALNRRNTDPGRQYRIYSFVVPPDESDLFEGGYRNDADYVIRAEHFGIPQARHRVILLGVAVELDKEPEFLDRSPSHPLVSIDHVLTGLPQLRSRLSKGEDSAERWAACIQRQAKKMCSELRRLGHDQIVSEIDRASSRIKKHLPTKSFTYPTPCISAKIEPELEDWILRDRPDTLLNHETRGHIEADLGRYLFAACWARAYRDSDMAAPRAADFPPCLAPDHANWSSGHFADRFRVQIKGRPATTITSHISKDGHYYIHYDPTQCRSLTVREAARIQTFPDNYFFEGGRTAQYVQVGNAVPPFLAKQLARVVHRLLES